MFDAMWQRLALYDESNYLKKWPGKTLLCDKVAIGYCFALPLRGII